LFGGDLVHIIGFGVISRHFEKIKNKINKRKSWKKRKKKYKKKSAFFIINKNRIQDSKAPIQKGDVMELSYEILLFYKKIKKLIFCFYYYH
jgi:hypothetical protein